MKKTQLLITALCASALLLGACNQPKKKKSSSSVTSSQQEKVLSSIAVTTNPTKTSYAVGESFDPSGMVVTATYSDGSASDVTGQCTFLPSVMAESTTSVTVSYEGKTTTVAVNKADWSAADLEVFEAASHGLKIPFPNEGEYTFALDSYGESGEYLGGDSSAAKIASYKARFDTTWEVTDFRQGVGFIAEKEVTTAEGTRYADVICAGYDESTEQTTEDGSGKFYLMVYDPYYYSWDDRSVGEEINYYFSYFASIGHASYVDAELPLVGEFHHMGAYISDIASYEYYAAAFYSMGYRYTSPFEFEDEIDIYCDQTFAATFIDALGDESSDFALDMVYEGINYYSSKQGSLGLQVGYVEDYGVLFVAPFQNATAAFPSAYVKEVMDVHQPEAEPFPAFAPSSTTSAYFYFEDFDNAYIVDCLGNGANVAEADLTSYISGLDSEKFEVGEKQTFEGGSYYLVSSKDGAYQFCAYYYEESETMWAYVEFEIVVALPASASLPLAFIDAYWEANGLTVPAAHAFAVVAESSFELAQLKDGYFDIYVYGATSEELATFVAGFDTESWAVESDTESGSYELICGDMSVVGNYVAVIDIEDYTDDEDDPCIVLEYFVGVVPEPSSAE